MLSATLLATALFLAGTSGKSFNWTTIEPMSDLHYHSCYGSLRCARLKVPLDWQRPNDTATVAIAIVSLPAVVPEDDPSFGGTIILNPGGPGESGVTLMEANGRWYQSFMDRDKHYELLSFDPRGVNNTTPSSNCFDDAATRNALVFQELGVGGWELVNMESGLGVIARQKAMKDAHGIICQNKEKREPILEYLSTASVARDMVEIVDRVDKLRRQRYGKKTEKTPRLNFYGYSYGTFLGNTFASMFPGRVGRMILNAVVDPEQYIQWWLHSFQDMNAIVDYFYESCHKADNCLLKRENDTSGGDIQRRVDGLMASLDTAPAAVVLDNGLATVVDGNAVRDLFSIGAYTPYVNFPFIAEIVSQALAGNLTLLAQFLLPAEAVDDNEYGIPVLCADGDDVSHYNASFWNDYFQELKNQSGAITAPRAAAIRFSCAGWRNRPKWRFTGPFKSAAPSSSLEDNAPAAPLLLFTNRLDPAAPAASAFLVSQGHPNSSVVVQEAVGHGVFEAAWSDCAVKILQDYLEFGTVPANGTVCVAGCNPWKAETCIKP